MRATAMKSAAANFFKEAIFITKRKKSLSRHEACKLGAASVHNASLPISSCKREKIEDAENET